MRCIQLTMVFFIQCQVHVHIHYMSYIHNSLSPFLSGPPIQIIPDYRAREEGDTDIDKQQLQLEEEDEGEEEDRAFAMVLEDAGIGDSISTYRSTMYVHIQL